MAAALALRAAAWRAALAPNVHAAAQSSEMVPTGIMIVARGGLGWTEGWTSLARFRMPWLCRWPIVDRRRVACLCIGSALSPPIIKRQVRLMGLA